MQAAGSQRSGPTMCMSPPEFIPGAVFPGSVRQGWLRFVIWADVIFITPLSADFPQELSQACCHLIPFSFLSP